MSKRLQYVQACHTIQLTILYTMILAFVKPTFAVISTH